MRFPSSAHIACLKERSFAHWHVTGRPGKCHESMELLPIAEQWTNICDGAKDSEDHINNGQSLSQGTLDVLVREMFEPRHMFPATEVVQGLLERCWQGTSMKRWDAKRIDVMGIIRFQGSMA